MPIYTSYAHEIPHEINIGTFREIMKEDDVLTGVRRQMNLNDVIESYPALHEGLKTLIQSKYGNTRARYFPYMASVVSGKEKWSPDCFYIGVKSEYKEEFIKWKEEFKNYIIDNENQHEFWIL